MGEYLRSLQRLRKIDLADPDQKRRYTRRLFSTVAPRYGTATRVLSFGRDAAWKRRLIRELPHLPQRSRCLDLACGTGDLCFLLARSRPEAAVTGVDLNPGMLALARKRLLEAEGDGTAGRGKIRFEEGDMHALRFPDGSFDLVIGGYALRNAPDLRQALREIRRVLRPGGTAAFLEFANSPRPYVRSLRYVALRLWGRLWGRILHGDPEIYGYIAESLRHFPDRGELEELFSELGFAAFRSRSLLGGFLAIVQARRS